MIRRYSRNGGLAIPSITRTKTRWQIFRAEYTYIHPCKRGRWKREPLARAQAYKFPARSPLTRANFNPEQLNNRVLSFAVPITGDRSRWLPNSFTKMRTSDRSDPSPVQDPDPWGETDPWSIYLYCDLHDDLDHVCWWNICMTKLLRTCLPGVMYPYDTALLSQYLIGWIARRLVQSPC